MEELGHSRAGLVQEKKPSHLVQYIAALSVAMGALSFGAGLGYASPASPMLKDNSTNASLVINEEQVNWFSSTVNIGALVGGPVGGLCINLLGRRGAMLASVPPFLASWALIAFAQNFAMLVSGRILVGVCAGVTCIAVPTYIGEIASPDIRGTLSTFFQLMVVVGIEFAYIFGAIVNSWRGLAGVCAIPVVVYFVLILFVKESPSYLLSKGKEKQAREVLQHFRGKHYNVDEELQGMREAQEESERNKISMKDLTEPYILKPLLICLALMVFQQLAGINAVLFNLATIFEDAGSSLSDDASVIIVGMMQVLATLAAGALMDRAGRKLLLIISASAMVISLVTLDVFFYEKAQDEAKAVSSLGWLPLTSLIVYIIAFSVGYGPIPWVMMGELFSLNVREAASGLATMTNWTTSFIITLLFAPLQTAIGPYGVYWVFAGFCAINLIFCLLVVPETKGKTLQEITAYFGAPNTTTKKEVDDKLRTDDPHTTLHV
ncbi:facilitated trehalose transporter Tret1 [Procambarus clarkii]|uniref:facilitated trehalose transporter Tret1 n=1 Tax=Procambarus clarkii TaxID=6728 RepID=UPI001E675AF6|nr:facilitated trehalose transporter Tret1-like [Procambarus clarkii]XP_045595887.1 facilitated trehalose transporter Tret1-like [Procambarus clarkii]